MKHKLIFVGFAIFVLSVLGISGYLLSRHYNSSKDQPQSQPQNQQQPTEAAQQQVESKPVNEFNKNLYSLDDPASLWVVVNKKRPLPASYAPGDLTNVGGESVSKKAAGSLEQLLAAARSDGVSLNVISGYRSYQTQKNVYNRYVANDSQAAADTYSARPGHSEHQTGLAVDLGNSGGSCDLETCFANTAGGRWLASNAYKYGFVVRYLEGKQNETGFIYEPWHLRFVGPELASQLKDGGQTMEGFFGLGPAPGY